MDFFEHQDAARRRTGWLVLYFGLAVAAIIVTIYLAIVLALVFSGEKAADRPPRLWIPELFLVVAGATSFVVLCGSAYKVLELRRGGHYVALMLGGRLIDSHTAQLAERRILNVVEEMAIASGIAVPPVYLLDFESGINAFAAGYKPDGAVIGITRGALEYLDRDELQGVMAHEFSHILNGDMRLNIRLMGVLHGILLLATIGYYLLRSGAHGGRSRGKDKGGGGIALLGLLLLIVGYIGVFFGKLIKAAVNRQREFLADASAVQFTRNPGGIAGALIKIGGLAYGSRVGSPAAEEASHAFFGNALANFSGLLATHPPLAERIRRIEPSFDGTFPAPKPIETVATLERERRSDRESAARAAALVHRAAGARAKAPDYSTVVKQVGTVGPHQVAFSAALLRTLPRELLEAAHDPFSARALVYALLLDAKGEVRARQLEVLRETEVKGTEAETRRLAQAAGALPERARLPVVELAVAALRSLSLDQYRRFKSNVEQLAQADRQISLFEYALVRLLVRHLEVHFGLARPDRVRYRSLVPLRGPLATALSAVSHAGSAEEAGAQSAFRQGTLALAPLRFELALVPRERCTLEAVDGALAELAAADGRTKRQVIAALSAAIRADRTMTAGEIELLRAVAASLDCPIPPIFTE